MPSYAGPSVSSRSGEVAGTLKLLAYLAVAIVLIVLDNRGSWLSRLRGELDVVVEPVWWAAGLPGKLGTRLHDDAGTLAQLTGENRELRNQLLIANARLARLSMVATENAQLRGMLGGAEERGLDVQLAPVLNIDLDPSRQRLILDAGSNQGVHAGQGVIDAGGLIGQIVQTTATNATVLMITDPDHAVPAMVGRNGVRLVVYGNGHGDALELVNVPLNADVKAGDLIVTSGLGGRFPAGFPVGTVTELHHDDSHTFLVGTLKPAAQLDRGRDVLLLKSDQAHPPQPGDVAGVASSAAPVAQAVVPAANASGVRAASSAVQPPKADPAAAGKPVSKADFTDVKPSVQGKAVAVPPADKPVLKAVPKKPASAKPKPDVSAANASAVAPAQDAAP